MNGEKQAGGPLAEWVIRTPVMRPGESRTVRVRAEWTAKGESVEYTGEVTLGPGDRTRRSILSGTPVGATTATRP